MCHALRVKVDGASTHHRLLKHDVTRIGGERVSHTVIGLRRATVGALTKTRPRGAGEAVEIKTKSQTRLGALPTHQAEA